MALSQVSEALTDVAVPPAAHTRVPTGNRLGPVVTSLLSRPTTSHVMGLIVRLTAAAAGCAESGAMEIATPASRAARRVMVRLTLSTPRPDQVRVLHRGSAMAREVRLLPATPTSP